ncbi:MalY/PatB family protein [Isachenkonia alkalipeptolytica]|uniref:cysteine-S-conjugate beta-lyase n=1 Tax=Isachenkonia alkalipeptolytica TaxID=2565777 RepID=A0AA43XI39_9CLOT|nr:MalY/PatB family protein [Isachenkonia alkalipeptolytica]NBG87258.1 pyridoxal phosphate-dependent aminotransferase [Isachenkonia alkalipeptolytica]
MKPDFDKMIDRKESKSIKWDSKVLGEMFGEEDLLPLWVADMDFEAPKEVVDAMQEEVSHGVFGYSKRGEQYYENILRWYKKRFDWEIKKDWLVFTPGVVSAVNYVLQALVEQGQGVIIQEPVYYPFKKAIKNNGCRVVNNPLKYQQGTYEIDFEDFEKKAKDPSTKLFILCSPHNPVGRVWKKEELRRLGEICLENDVLIFSDEIHHDLVFEKGAHHVLANLDSKFDDHVITATAPSKTFNLAGLMSAHLIIKNDSLKRRYRRILEINHIGKQTPISMAAVEAAYGKGEPWLEALLDYLRGNLDLIDSMVKDHLPRAKFTPPEATYLAWLDLREYGFSGKELEERITKEAKVALDGGTWFGSGGDGFIRINFACPRKTLQKALDRIVNALEGK